MGLREDKKLATRRALSEAAVRLAVERGIENVRVGEIAAAVRVSPRTFNNYFSSKEEAMAALRAERAPRLSAALRERPRHEPLWKAIIAVVAGQFEGIALDREFLARVHLLRTPAMLGEFFKAGEKVAHGLAEAIAVRTGTDVEHDLYPRLVAGVVVSAEQEAIFHWAASEDPPPLAELVRHVLEQLASGLPEPKGK